MHTLTHKHARLYLLIKLDGTLPENNQWESLWAEPGRIGGDPGCARSLEREQAREREQERARELRTPFIMKP